MKREAFSLIELLIVIVIIGVVYTLVIANFQKIAKEETSLSLENIKEYLSSQEYDEKIKVLCLVDCSSCDIVVDGNITKSIDGFLDETVRSYKYDSLYGFVELEAEAYFNVQNIEENVCFSYELNRAGVGSQILVEYKENYYDLSKYFTQIEVYSSLEDARESKEDLMQEVRQ